MSNLVGHSENQPSRVSFTVRRPSPVSSRQSSARPETNAATTTPSFRIPPPPRQQAGYSTAPSRLKYEQTEQEEVDSSDEEDREATELVSGFDSIGVQGWVNLFSYTKELSLSRTNHQHLLCHRVKPPAKSNGPLVIPVPNWRQLARQRQAANGYNPDSARDSAITGPDGSQGGLGTRDSINSEPQLTSILQKPSTPPAEPAANEPNEPEPAVDGDTEMTPAQPLTEDEIALQALLPGTDETASKPQVAAIPLAPMTEEATLERDMADLPDTATLEDYARVPVEQFGTAMLRGMGWKPPKNGEDELWIPAERPALLGLGAKARPVAQGSGGAKGQTANWKNAERKYVPLVQKDRNGDVVDDARDSASSGPRSGQASRRNLWSRSPRGRSDSSRRDSDREFAPELDTHRNTLQEVLPAPGETSLSPNLLEALKNLRQALAPPTPGSGRRIFQSHVWQGAATNGLTILLLNATQNLVQLDQQGTISEHLFACIHLIFAAGVESKHLEAQAVLNYTNVVNEATTVIPLAIHEYWSKFRSRVKRDRGILKNLVDLGCMDYQASKDAQVLSFRAL
ncbi:hypothetical protein FRC01_003617 [Tulasnella sp. 417]|nr:hypothetical protein FRC01_003617 [Tulasnella sp. 417]